MFVIRTVPVSRLYCALKNILPPRGVVKPDICERNFTMFAGERDRKHLHTLRCLYVTTIAAGLFDVVFVFFKFNFVEIRENTEVFK